MEGFLTRFAVRLVVGLLAGGILYSNFGQPSSPPPANPTRPSRQTSRPATAQPSVGATQAADERLGSLWTLISDPGLSYHLSGTGVSKSDASTLRFTLELDITGDDYTGRVNSIGSSGKAQLVRKDGVMYARQRGKGWAARRVPTDSVLQFVPFLNIRAKEDLQADGIEERTGRPTLYRYVSTSRYRPDVAHMMNLSRFSGRCDVLQLALLVTDAAIPVSARFECRMSNDLYSGVSDYKFKAFGETFSIEAPVKPPT